MLTIALIRPGESEYDQQGRVQGNLDIPLSENGQKQIDRIAGELQGEELEVVYAPATEPAWTTAQRLAAAWQVKAKELDDMASLDCGLWQGLLVDEVKRKQPKVFRQWQENPAAVCPPEGETLADAQQRVEHCLQRLKRKHKGGRIGLVLPEPLASLALAHFQPNEIRDIWRPCAERPAWEWIGNSQPAAVQQ